MTRRLKIWASGTVGALFLAMFAGTHPASAACSADFCGWVDAASTKWVQHSVQVTADGTITAVLDWDDPSANLNLGLRDPSGKWVQWAASLTAKPEQITYLGGTVGTWTLGVSAKSGAANYALEVSHSGEAPPATGSAQYLSSFGFGPNEAGHAGLYPYGMDWEPSSNTILVGDIWNHRVVRFTREGQAVSGFEIKKAGSNRIEPFDVEAGPDGSVWVANEAYSRVDHFDHDGNWIKSIGKNGSPGIAYPVGCGGGSQHWPSNIAVHPTNGRLYVSDGFCRDVSAFDASTGEFLFAFGLDPAAFGVTKITPRGIDIDGDGNIVLVEHQSRRIAKLNPDTGALIAGWPNASTTAVADPRGLAVDRASGRIYVVGAFWNDVYRFDAHGGYLGRWTHVGTDPATEFDSIRYVAIDGTGDVFVGDTWGYRVWHLTTQSTTTTATAGRWDSGPKPPPRGGYNQVAGIGVDKEGSRLFTADTFENRAQAFQTQQQSGSLWWCRSATDCPSWLLAFGNREPNIPNSPGFNYPRGLGVGGGSVWIDAGNSIVRYDLNGNFVGRWGSWGKGPGQFIQGPMGIAVVPTDATTGKVYTTDLGNCRLMVSDYGGKTLATMGSCGTGTNQMKAPWQIDVRGNRAYVADRGRGLVVWNLDTNSIVEVISGAFEGVNLREPYGVAVDPAGKWAYISDTGNRRIVRVSLDGSGTRTVVTKGTDTPEGSFRLPRFLAFDAQGHLYVSDFNQRVYAYRVPAT